MVHGCCLQDRVTLGRVTMVDGVKVTTPNCASAHVATRELAANTVSPPPFLKF